MSETQRLGLTSSMAITRVEMANRKRVSANVKRILAERGMNITALGKLLEPHGDRHTVSNTSRAWPDSWNATILSMALCVDVSELYRPIEAAP